MLVNDNLSEIWWALRTYLIFDKNFLKTFIEKISFRYSQKKYEITVMKSVSTSCIMSTASIRTEIKNKNIISTNKSLPSRLI